MTRRYKGADAAINARQTELRHLNDRKLHAFAKAADDRLFYEIDRVQCADPDFRKALFDSMAADAEVERWASPPTPFPQGEA